MPALDAIAASGHELLAVVTRPDAPAGRGRGWSARRSARWADERGIEVLTPARPRDPEFLDRLRELAPDCVPVVAYGALVPPVALEIPRHGWINLHFSLLPAWRGAAPGAARGAARRRADRGERVPAGGGPGHRPGLRHADRARSAPPTPPATCWSGSPTAGAGLLVAVLDAIEAGTARAEPQPADGVSLAPKLTVEDARVRWTDPAFAVDRRIRACTPAPGAVDDVPRRAGQARPGDAGGRRPRAEARASCWWRSARVLVGTATVPVGSARCGRPARRPMPATDWARGVRVGAGEVLA